MDARKTRSSLLRSASQSDLGRTPENIPATSSSTPRGGAMSQNAASSTPSSAPSTSSRNTNGRSTSQSQPADSGKRKARASVVASQSTAASPLSNRPATPSAAATRPPASASSTAAQATTTNARTSDAQLATPSTVVVKREKATVPKKPQSSVASGSSQPKPASTTSQNAPPPPPQASQSRAPRNAPPATSVAPAQPVTTSSTSESILTAADIAKMPTDQVLALIAPGNETTSDPSAAGPSGISATNPASSAWSTARRDGLEEEDPELQRALHESFFEDQELQRAIRESLALSNNSPDAGPSGASSSTMANTSSPSSAPPVPAASDSPNTESSANTPAVPPTDSATGAAPAVPASSVPSQNDDQPSIPDSQQGIYRRSSLSDIYMSRSPSPVLPELGDLLRGTPAPPTSSQPRPSLDKAPSQIPIVPNPARESESEADIPLASARLVILKSPPKKKVSTTPTAIPPISSQNGRERAQTRGRPPPPVSTDSRRPPSTTSQPKPKRKRSIPPASTNSFGLPPNKKSRLSNSSSRMTPRRSEKFWHLDGSVVVRVQDTLFKVHRSRLVYESEYFKKLFEGRGESRVGSGGEDEMDDLTKIDGCAVYEVDVEGLSVNDFEVLLSAMDEAITYVTRPPKFFVLLSILRAATHLDFEKYTSYAIFRLSSFLPSELHAMTELRMGIHPTWARQAVICCRLYRSARVFCDPCQDDKVVKGILKRAFYELARVSELGVCDGLVDVDPDTGLVKNGKGKERERDINESFEMEGMGSGEFHEVSLAPEDFKLQTTIRAKLTQVWLLVASTSPNFTCPLDAAPPAPNPPNPEASASTLPTPKRCLPANEKMMHWIGSVHTSGIFQKYIYDPICGLQALIDAAGEWEKEGYCYECVRTRIETWTDRRERLWDELEFWLLQWGPL